MAICISFSASASDLTALRLPLGGLGFGMGALKGTIVFIHGWGGWIPRGGGWFVGIAHLALKCDDIEAGNEAEVANVGGNDGVSDFEGGRADEEIHRRNGDSGGSLFAVASTGKPCG